MKPCIDRMDTLLSDVHGEISPEERQQWERHLKGCTGCSEERRRLLALLRVVREELRDPVLPPEAEARLLRSITSALGEGRLGWRGRLGRWIPLRSLPALAAATMLVITLGWFGLRGGEKPSEFLSASQLESEERMIAEEMDLLEQLDLLEEMDVLQNLVKIVDEREARL